MLCLGIHGKSSIISIIVPFHSGHMAIDDLPNYKTARRLVEREMVRHYTNKKGEHRICGGKDLKSSPSISTRVPGYNKVVWKSYLPQSSSASSVGIH